MMPPKALNVRFNRGMVTAGERLGAVAAATIATGTVVTAVAAMLAGPSVFGKARAVGVIANVDDRARHVAVTADEDACPSSSTLPILRMSVAEPAFKAA